MTIGLIGGLNSRLFDGLYYGARDGLIMGLSYLTAGLIGGLTVGMIFGLVGGGDAVTKHLILRVILWLQGNIPWDYAKFLDYATERIFLRQV